MIATPSEKFPSLLYLSDVRAQSWTTRVCITIYPSHPLWFYRVRPNILHEALWRTLCHILHGTLVKTVILSSLWWKITGIPTAYIAVWASIKKIAEIWWSLPRFSVVYREILGTSNECSVVFCTDLQCCPYFILAQLNCQPAEVSPTSEVCWESPPTAFSAASTCIGSGHAQLEIPVRPPALDASPASQCLVIWIENWLK